MTAVYVLRHPQTTWNVAKRYQGRLEAPLSAEGDTQVELLCRAFSGTEFDLVASSPLERALRLAQPLSEVTGAPLHVDDRLIEIAMGPWEGLYLNEIQEKFAGLYHDWYQQPQQVRFPLGEALSDVRHRALSALSDVFERYPGGQVALVTHSVVVQMLVCASLRLDPQHVHQLVISNASVTTMCGTESPGIVLCLNDTAPLYHSPVASGAHFECSTWKRRRVTQ